MGDEFPNAEVWRYSLTSPAMTLTAWQILANDLSAVQPNWYGPVTSPYPCRHTNMIPYRVPPNVKFEIDDVESPWLHNIPFDYIFCRYMAACIKDWPRLVGNIYEFVLH